MLHVQIHSVSYISHHASFLQKSEVTVHVGPSINV